MAFARMGECAHSYLTRWLEGDTAIVLSSMETFSGKDDMSLEDAEKRLRTEKRQGRPMEVPAASAWKTLQAIRAKHAQQRASKKRKQDAFLQQSWQVFRNGMASADIADPELLGNARASCITRGNKLLQSADFLSQFRGVLLLTQASISYQEARDKKIVHYLQTLHDAGDTCGPMKALLHKLLVRWQKEKMEKRNAGADGHGFMGGDSAEMKTFGSAFGSNFLGRLGSSPTGFWGNELHFVIPNVSHTRESHRHSATSCGA